MKKDNYIGTLYYFIKTRSGTYIWRKSGLRQSSGINQIRSLFKEFKESTTLFKLTAYLMYDCSEEIKTELEKQIKKYNSHIEKNQKGTEIEFCII